MIEEWRPVPEFEDYYEISNLGQIRHKVTGHIKTQHDNGHGYKFVQLYKGKDIPHHRYVHRLVAMAFIPNPENKPQVDHLNTIKSDNRVENLAWVNQSENNLNPITKHRSIEARKTEAYKKKMHDALSGDKNGARTHRERNNFVINNPSKNLIGKHWFNNGEIELLAFECPEGFTKGRIIN